MPTEGQRIRAIMTEERATTLRQVEQQPHSVEIIGLWMAMQEAVNGYIQRADRVIPVAAMLAALSLQTDEVERINVRLVTEGLAPRVEEGG